MKKKKDILKEYITKRNLILKYNHHYFNLDSPLISDAEYDGVKKDLIKLEERFSYLKKYGSIKSKVGAPITNKFKKIKHSMPMLTL